MKYIICSTNSDEDKYNIIIDEVFNNYTIHKNMCGEYYVVEINDLNTMLKLQEILITNDNRFKRKSNQEFGIFVIGVTHDSFMYKEEHRGLPYIEIYDGYRE